jgi:hypothetical protein
VEGTARPAECIRDDGNAIPVKPAKNPAPGSSFGFASGVFRVGTDPAFRQARLRLSVEPALLSQNAVDLASLRLFHWNAQRKVYHLVPASAVASDRKSVHGRIAQPGLYVAIGLTMNPWVRSTVEVFRQLQPLLASPELKSSLTERICRLLLYPDPKTKELLRNPRWLAKHGLPHLSHALPASVAELRRGLELVNGQLPEHDIDFGRPLRQDRTWDRWSNTWWSLSDVTARLGCNSEFADAIVFCFPNPNGPVNGTPSPYVAWPATKKAELATACWNILCNQWGPGLSATPPVTLTLYGNGDLFSADLSPDDAWSYFIAYVAQSLAVEIAGWVPWSLLDYGSDGRTSLLDSRSLFEYSSTKDRYSVLSRHPSLFNHGAAMPGDPVRTFDFLLRENLVGADRRETIALLLDWCRINLVHFIGGDDPSNLQAHWGYQGWPPVEHIIAGTTHPVYGFRHWTAGCWGTTGFLRTVLRTANIPVLLEERSGHALPYFQSDALYLSHGDDPYNAFSKATPPFPAEELLIDQATFDAWFGTAVPAMAVDNNIGRRTLELAIQYLPNALLRDHCADLASNLGHDVSKVLDDLSRIYTLAQLEAADLWGRMVTKVASFGGCANIPA